MMAPVSQGQCGLDDAASMSYQGKEPGNLSLATALVKMLNRKSEVELKTGLLRAVHVELHEESKQRKVKILLVFKAIYPRAQYGFLGRLLA